MSVSCLFSHLLSAAWCESDSNGQEIAGQMFDYLQYLDRNFGNRDVEQKQHNELLQNQKGLHQKDKQFTSSIFLLITI